MSNPALTKQTFRAVGRAESADTAMTLNGTLVKTGILTLLLVVAGAVSWQTVRAENVLWVPMLLGGCLGGLAVALVTIFVPRLAPWTAPLYAALEGLALGVLSAVTESVFSGIVFQAAVLTVSVLGIMLFLYLTRIIQPTRRFSIAVVSATCAICLFYLVSIVLMFCGVGVSFINEMLYGNGVLGIGFSLFVVGIAALNLILDFGLIEAGVATGAPKYMEWYGGFSLLVTLVWLYLEVLRLLAKLRSR
jgi:uncharacterized YccA/Bax inhibitor family protein